jgi:MFS family permease
MLDLSRKQWTVLFAAWLGWGFDVFDALLFSYVAPNCIPTLLGLTIGSKEAQAAAFEWGGYLNSLLLIGWAAGGALFGVICDRMGRKRTMMLTMIVYALGTAACAFAPSLAALIAFRVIASLAIGGEWAAGAAMVAETVPDHRRVEAGALLYTASPMGLFLAAFVNYQIAAVWLPGSPATSWRFVFLFGLIPAAIAFVIRSFVQEPERWTANRNGDTRLRDLFSPAYRQITIVGALLSTVSLLTWWSCNAFIPTVVTSWAHTAANERALNGSDTLALVESWKFRATLCFNLGGLIGTLLTIPFAKHFGRRPMFAGYFALSAIAIFATFGINMPAEARVLAYFFNGVLIFGVAGAFTYYLPELFPTRLRATGAGFCFNIGRVFAAIGPLQIGVIAAQGRAIETLFYVGFVPLAALLLLPWMVETKGKRLADSG